MEYIEMIELGIALASLLGLTYLAKAYNDAKKLVAQMKELFQLVDEANRDGKVTEGEFNTLLDQIALCMKTGNAFVSDIENLKSQVEALLKRKA